MCQSDRSRQVMADHTGHHMHHDDPDLVARVVGEMVDQIRGEVPRTS